MQQKILVSGGAGFIGSSLIRLLIQQKSVQVINIDVLNYAGDLSRIDNLTQEEQARHHFIPIDICDFKALEVVFLKEQPDAVIHLAAETHVDRSIDDPKQVVQTNVIGTLNMLEATRMYWKKLSSSKKSAFRFLHVSTDEVYGNIHSTGSASKEGDLYQPNSPYSASKAGADHLVRAWYHTYQLPVLLTHSCNNYGAYQHPEKLIPHMIFSALKGQMLPIYGDGLQERQWIFVEDHVRALWVVLNEGRIGQTYHIGTDIFMRNIELVHLLCDELEKYLPSQLLGVSSYRSLIHHVADRPAHDRRYALSTQKIAQELGWRAQVTLEEGVSKTVAWYVKNQSWAQRIFDKGYALKRQGLMLENESISSE